MGEMFLQLEGIQGESLDEASPVAHKGEIEIHSWNWSTECKVFWEKNQGGQSANITFKEVEIHKICDLASVTLYQFCVTGKHIPRGKITCRKNDGDQKLEYFFLKMKDIIVSRVAFDGDGEATLLKETVLLSFAEFDIEYNVQTDLGGRGAGTHFGYNIQTLKPRG